MIKDNTLKYTLAKEHKLDEADRIVLTAFLYRPAHLEQSKTMPKQIVDACKYLRARYDYGLFEAKTIVDVFNIEVNKS